MNAFCLDRLKTKIFKLLQPTKRLAHNSLKVGCV
jgi:hypothetical protein